jgi:CRP-like cAMP-binding protein
MAGQTPSQNHLLSTLSRADAALLWPHFKAMDLPLRFVLEAPNKSIKQVYFLEAGIASVVASDGQEEIEAGIFGSEGMSGMAVVLGDDRSPHSTYMQVKGRGLRMTDTQLRGAMDQSASLRVSLLRFVQAFMSQTAQTALANGRANIERRLSRWILMAHDRLDVDTLPITHEFLGLMLGVRRSGVTIALHELQQSGLIRAARGLVVVADRKGLEKLAGRIYGVSVSEYRRLTGWVPLHSRSVH